MEDAEIIAYFDGRGRAEFLLGGLQVMHADKIAAIAYEFGYDLREVEMPSRGSYRMVYVRNDSPEVRRRAQQTLDRLRAGGPLLSVWVGPGARPGAVLPISAIEMASMRRGIDAYESHGVRRFAVFVALLSLGCFVLAWAHRDTPGAALAVVVMLGIPLAVTAAMTPRWMKRRHEKNRRLVQLYDQQRSGRVGPPPPPPPLPPLPPPPSGPAEGRAG
ncbi:hypothetical protein [Streptomyces sp. NBC_01615]|uniref:hypothetical protein n=1 Tax=Streptomyces sp. NBC_01615 TaxID=2975898 RepID=UPI00386E7634